MMKYFGKWIILCMELLPSPIYTHSVSLTSKTLYSALNFYFLHSIKNRSMKVLAN